MVPNCGPVKSVTDAGAYVTSQFASVYSRSWPKPGFPVGAERNCAGITTRL